MSFRVLFRPDATACAHTHIPEHTEARTHMLDMIVAHESYLDSVIAFLQVCDWLNSNMLAAFAPTFSKHKIDSLHKASMMTREQVGLLHFHH